MIVAITSRMIRRAASRGARAAAPVGDIEMAPMLSEGWITVRPLKASL